MSRAVIAEKATHAGEKAMEMLDQAPSVVSRARSLVSGDAQFFSAQPKLDVIRKQLDSDSIQEKKDGMKRVIAQICKGHDMSSLFPDVVKNILIQSIELRKLVYYFIVHYAEERPNEALLSISAFQKDLVDSSMHVRSLALRMLSSIRISAIQPVVMVAIKKCASDMSPVVRKTAAISLAQMHSISTGDETDMILIPLVEQFLGDKSPDVTAAAALSMIEICPNKMELIHKHFRKICRSLVECDEWGQVILLHILLRYARTQFLDPNRTAEKKGPEAGAPAKADDDDDDSSSDSDVVRRRVGRENEQLAKDLEMDSDHRLLLSSVKPLLLSMNRAVVVGAASLYFHCGPTDELDICVKPLLRLLGGASEGHSVVLSAIHTLVLSRPLPFVPHVKEFFINSEDTSDVRDLKIRIISKLTTQANFTPVIHEFRSYLRSFDIKKVIQALHGLGLISSAVTDSSTQIMRLITPLLSHKCTDVITESVVILRQLVVQGTDKNQTCKVVHRLLQQVMKEEIKSSVARASILWLVGENIQTHIAIAQAAPDCFRTFAKNFTKEDPQVKKQVLTLGAKIWLHLEGEGALAARFKQLFFYVLELVKYDADYEVRDLGRSIECTIDRQSATFTSMKNAVLAPKPLPQQNDPFLEKAKYQLGSLSHLFGNALLGYQELPSWPSVAPDATVRDPPGETKSDSASSRSAYSDDESTSDESEDSDETESDSGSSASSSSKSSESSSSASGSSSDSSESSGRRGSHQRIASPVQKKSSKKTKAPPAVVMVKKLVINRVATAGAPAPKPATAEAPVSPDPKSAEPEEQPATKGDAPEPGEETPAAAEVSAEEEGNAANDQKDEEEANSEAESDK